MTDFDFRKKAKKFEYFGDFIVYCSNLVENESWETRKEMFKKLYCYNGDCYFWEENMMFNYFSNNREEWEELYNIVFDTDD